MAKFYKSKKFIIPATTIALFVVISFLSQRYSAWLGQSDFLNGPWGEAVYALIMLAAVIIAPFETLPLLPVAATIWGPNEAAILTIIGWTAGSIVAFTLARKFGKKLVYRFANREQLEEWAKTVSCKKLFWVVAFARFVLPIDIISYAVGLFTKMPWYLYVAATVAGIIPFAYLFSYASQLQSSLQAVLAGILIVVLALRFHKIKNYFSQFVKIFK
jgi:uncharacterized membrane protein YdjX (TVP38/TMEM64 family)